MGAMLEKIATYAWDTQSIKVIALQKQLAADDGDILVTLKDLHVNNYHTIEIWLRVRQVKNQKCGESTMGREL